MANNDEVINKTDIEKHSADSDDNETVRRKVAAMDHFASEAYKSQQCARNSAPPEYKPCHDNVSLIRAELKATIDERDMLRFEVERLHGRLDAYQRQSLSSAANESRSAHSYDRLKAQCDAIMDELQSLHMQHDETVQSYRKAKEKSEQLSSTVAVLHSQLDDANADRRRLQEENSRLRNVLDETERRGLAALRLGSPVANSSDGDISLSSSSGIRMLAGDTEPADGLLTGSNLVEVVKLLKMENAHLRDDIQAVERDRKIHERNMAVAMQAEKSSLLEKLRAASIVQRQLEMQLTATVSSRAKDTHDLSRIREERNAAVTEYELVMSERDTVLRETEQLRSTVTALEAKLDGAMKEKQAATEEAEKARVASESTRKEAEALSRSSIASMDYLKEIERLRRDMDKLQGELMDALHELDSSKRRCNWAFGERDKIVGERESIRALCDQLRRERDAAVSDLISALRDSDETRRQKNDIVRDLKEIRERYEALMEKEMGSAELNMAGHHHSRDSAIDTDLHDLEMEMLEIDLGDIRCADLGFDLIGGSNDIPSSNSNLVCVGHIYPTSVAHGKLSENDQIVRVNNIDVSNADREQIFRILCTATPPIRLTVRRPRRVNSRILLPVHITLSRHHHEDLGINVEQGIYVSRIVPGSIVAREDSLSVGDRILGVDGVRVDGKSVSAIRQMIDECRDPVLLDVIRYNTSVPPSNITSSPSSAFRTPSSPLASMELSPPGPHDTVDYPQNIADGPPAQSAGLRDAAEAHPTALEGSHSEVMLRSATDPSLGRGAGRNFLDKAVSVITRPFMRSRLNRTTRDARCKSAFPYIGGSASQTDDFVPISSDSRPTASSSDKVAHQDASAQQGNQTSSERKLSDGGHGTWPKCRAHVPVRPSILPIYSIRPSSSTDEESPLLPKPGPRGIEIRRSESARHHRPQNSDSVVDYVRPPGSAFSPHKMLTPFGEERQRSAPPRDHDDRMETVNATALGPHYAKCFPDQTNETTVTVRSHAPVEHHVTVISHFPVDRAVDDHAAGTFGNVGCRYSPRPASRTMPYTATSLLTSVERPNGQGRMLGPSAPPTYSPQTSVVVTPRPQPYSIPSTMNSASPRPSYTSVTSPVLSSANPAVQSGSLYPHYPSHHIMTSPYLDLPSDRSTDAYSLSSQTSLRRSAGCDQTIGSYRVTHPDSNQTLVPEGSSPNMEHVPPFTQLPGDHRWGRIRMPPSRGPSPISPVFPSTQTGPCFVPGSSFSLPNRQHKDRPRPRVGETRTITADLPSRPLGIDGIDIECSQTNGGIFVSMVEPCSAASRAGLVVGDQLLEVCGINMRSATKQIAANVLRQCAGTVSMLVQYNPNKFAEVTANASNTSSEESVRAGRHNGHGWLHSRPNTVLLQSLSQLHAAGDNSSVRSTDSTSSANPQRLVVRRKMHPHDPIGLTIVGGNFAGIFVRSVEPGSLLDGPNGVHCGDQVLQYNGVEFFRLTLEQAILETRKPCDEVRCCVQYNIIKYNSTLVSKMGGDAFYMRALCDYSPTDATGAVQTRSKLAELSFRHGDVLLVDSTAHAGQLGVWHAWLLDVYGEYTGAHGILPTKARFEDELLRRRSTCDILEASSSPSDFNKIAGVRNSGSFRRSLLFRRRRHRRSDSRDANSAGSAGAGGTVVPQMHPSHSDASINSGCSGHTLDEGSLLSLERVEKLDCHILRPVILIGPFSDQLIAKLTSESPDKFSRLDRDSASSTPDSLTGRHKSPSPHYGDLDVDCIRSIAAKNRHCLLNSTPDAVDYLHRAQIFPIVLFIKHKNPKQIREVKDARFMQEKVSSKMAKDLFERFQEYERIYLKIFSDVIPGGNLAFMSCKIKTVIDREQRKIIWIPASSRTS